MQSRGCIDSCTNGIVSGWLVAEKQNAAHLYVNGKFAKEITDYYIRQDIIDLGITEAESGFNVDISEYVTSLNGTFLLELKHNDIVVASFEAYIPSQTNLIENDFLKLEDFNTIGGWKIGINHRVGFSLANFVAPKGLEHANGHYTRFSFGDTSNTRHKLKLTPTLNIENIFAKTLKLAIVAKASHSTHINFLLTDKHGENVVNEPIALSHKWEHLVVEVSEEHTSDLFKGELEVSFTTKHHGRRFIDIAMIQLSEELIAPSKEVNDFNGSDFSRTNLIKNGSLQSWPNGIIFNSLTRGQELAENWFIEMSKANLANLAVAAISDNTQNDPLADSITSKFGLRVRAKKLDGYARLIVPIAKQNLSEIDYQIELDLEASGLNNKVTIPRIYLIARDARNDSVVYDIVRKQVINNREKLLLKVDAKAVNEILTSSHSFPALTVAIDLPEENDISIYGLSFHARPLNENIKEKDSPNKKPSLLRLEDPSITAQLSALKGLELWSSEKAIKPYIKPNKPTNEITLDNSNEFIKHINSLKPNKLTRPSREFPFIDIVVPVYNACDDVLLCLSALIEKTDLLHRVIVINDGQDERTAIMLEAFNSTYNHLEVITNPENIGYTRSVNKGIKHSNADWVVVLNSDTIVSKGWLSKLMNCALSQDNVGMVGALSNAASWQSVPYVHDASGDWHLNPLPGHMTIDDMASKVAELSLRDYPEVGVINGFCQLINTRMLDDIGLLDDVAFPIGYGEENDMCARAIKAGYTLLIADDTYVFHAKSKSFGHSKRKELAKQGSAALKKKHPDVDWGSVTKRIFEHPSLVELRKQLEAALAE